MEEKGLSVSKLSFKAEMQRTQLNYYLNGNIKRIDLAIMARLCYALKCDINDLIKYVSK